MDFAVYCPFLLLTHIYHAGIRGRSLRLRPPRSLGVHYVSDDIISPRERELSCFRQISHMYFLCCSCTNVSFKPLAAPSSFIRMNYIIPSPEAPASHQTVRIHFTEKEY